MRVIELGGIGPGPHTGMVALADLGADVVRVRRPGTDACVTPVLTWSEATEDPHLSARATVINTGGVDQPGPPHGSPARHPVRSGRRRRQPRRWTKSAGNRCVSRAALLALT